MARARVWAPTRLLVLFDGTERYLGRARVVLTRYSVLCNTGSCCTVDMVWGVGARAHRAAHGKLAVSDVRTKLLHGGGVPPNKRTAPTTLCRGEVVHDCALVVCSPF